MAKTPWWARVKGGHNAVQGMANFNVQPSLRNAWYVQNSTRLNDNPELSAAVSSANVPYALARRLDLAFQASKAQKQQNIQADAGRSPAMHDPAQSQPAQAQASADQQKEPERHGFWEHVGGFFQDVGGALGVGKDVFGREPMKTPGGQIATETAKNEATGNIPLWQQPFELGKTAVQKVGEGLSFAQAPLAAPVAAGNAADVKETANADLPWYARNPLGSGQNIKFGVGLTSVLNGAPTNQQEDMRRAGKDPNSWWDRYSWYGNWTGDNNVVSDKSVRIIKEEGHDPQKVDLAREILTVGALEHPDRYNGLSPQAQQFLTETQANKDKEGGDIFKKLADRSAVTLGGQLADAMGLELGSTDRQVVSALGDMAAYWYLDPTVVGGKAFTAIRDARYAVSFEPQAIKEAIVNRMGDTNTIAKRWDDIIDRVDKIHVLGETKTVEAQAQAAKEFSNFQRAHPDVMPFYDTLLGMRQGSVTGAFFSKGPENHSFRDITEFNPINIHRVDDPAKYKPVFTLRNGAGDKVTQDVRDAARAEVADRISEALIANRVLTGQPIINHQMLMPGQLRVTNAVRVPLQKFTDTLLGQDKKLLQQLKEAEGKGIIDFNAASSASAATAGVIDSAKGGQWIRENYTRGGLRDKAAMALSRFATTKDAPVLLLDGVDSTKTFHDFVRFFAPRGQSAFMANTWAKADPAQRSVMLNSMMESLANARYMKDGSVGADFWRQQLKGREAPIMPGEKVKEAYSSPDMDLIQTPSGPTAAAMYSTQFANGVQLPSFVEVLRNTEKVGPLSWLAGVSHSRMVTNFTRVTKVGQVGTTSNMMRQNLEGRALQFIDDPLGATHAAVARLGLAGGNAASRAAANDAIRQARDLAKSGEMDKLTPLLAQHKFDEYADQAKAVLSAKGKTVTPELDGFLRQGADVASIAKGRSAARLAVTKVTADPMRRLRARMYRSATEKSTEPFTYEWLDRVDDGFRDKLIDGTHRILGGNRAHYMDGGMVDEMDQVTEGVAAGQRLAQVKLKNTVGYLGAAGDSGALRWNNSLGLRIADPVGQQVLQAVARKALHEQNIEQVASTAVERARANAGRKGQPFGTVEEMAADAKARAGYTAGADDPVELARRLLTEDDAGAAYRLNGRRGQYLDGKYVGGTVDQTSALRGWADQMVQDAQRYLGLESHAILRGETDAAHTSLLSKLAKGREVSADDLAKVSEDFRPEQIHSPIVVGKKFLELGDGKLTDKIADGASKMYQFTVAGPLQRMLHDPQVVAAHSEAMAGMEPVARALADKGMSADNIYKTLDTMAYGHAIQRVTRYSDNPHVTSYFASLSNNFLWYERAMEDFARRAIRITKADPSKVARTALTIEAAHHSGVIYDQKMTDDAGNSKTETMFTWPGSGWAMRTLNEGIRSLGLADSDVVTVPVWQDWASPVKFLSPSLQNPLGFTSSPLIGMPLRVVKSLFPETTPTVESWLTSLEGGERAFGSQNAIESILPVYARRIWNTLDRSEQDSQYGSAMRNALIYLAAAGKLPAGDAGDMEHQRARDEVRQMVVNNLVWRSAFAMFAPATPGTMTTNISGIGDGAINEVDQLRGINSIRGEWFQLLEDMNKRFPSDASQAFSEAAIEWAKRDMGSIVNPQAFTVGTSGAPGDQTGKSVASNLPTTQWMLDNRDFLKTYGKAAYSLIPAQGSEYYNQIGYQTQLRTELRQHKSLEEFYKGLVISQANSDFYSRLTQRTDALDKTSDKTAQRGIYDEWNSYVADLKRANPVWAEQFNAQKDPDYISANIAPAVHRMAGDVNVPAEIKPLQPQLQQLAKLYDDYRTAQAKYPGTRYQDIQARRQISKQYNNRGNGLFKSTPLEPLWKSMQVFED